MKKNLFGLIGLSMTMFLVGCNPSNNTSQTPDDSIYKHSVSVEVSGATGGKVVNPENVTLTENFDSLTDKKFYNTRVLPSTGDVNILVVPLIVPGYETIDIDGDGIDDSERVKSDLDKAFFSSGRDDVYCSVKDYYYQSSYGKLNLSGEVTDYCEINDDLGYSYTNAANITLSDTYDIVNKVCDWLSDTKGFDLTKYDNNKDGYIDGIWCIYSCPNYSNGGPKGDDNNFWAYTSWGNQTPTKDRKPDVSKPIYNLFGWASYDFMYEGYGISKIDTHTYIHETGHFLGLNDYYSDVSSYNPIGKVDMMDSNIIDQNMYSKMLLGWTKPYLVTGNATIDLKSMQNENALIVIPGDSYVINDKNEFDPFSEYILIELYTNEGLNYDDSRRSVSDRPLAMNDKGVRIYHIDNRKFVVDVKSKKDDGTYTSKEYKTGDTVDSQHKIILPMSNDRGSSRYNYGFGVDSNDNLFDEVRVIEANNVDSFSNGGYQTSKTLFKEGSSFDIGTYSKFFINKSSDKTKGLLDTGDSFSKTISIGEIK